MSSSDFDTGLSGSICECGSMSGILERAEFRSVTRESVGMAYPDESFGCDEFFSSTSYNRGKELQTDRPWNMQEWENHIPCKLHDFA